MTNLEDALVAVEAGADAVGFVFYEKSPRCVSVETAREIVAKVPESVEKVGVFVNEPIESVSAIADNAGLTAVQFHGNEYEDPRKWPTDRRTFPHPFAGIRSKVDGRRQTRLPRRGKTARYSHCPKPRDAVR